MSHAYVEVGDATVAGRILRGEVGGIDGGANDEGNEGGRKVGKPRERGSVLGKGRRARGVTVTRSGQEELVSDVGVFFLWVLFLWDPISTFSRFIFGSHASIFILLVPAHHYAPFQVGPRLCCFTVSHSSGRVFLLTREPTLQCPLSLTGPPSHFSFIL